MTSVADRRVEHEHVHEQGNKLICLLPIHANANGADLCTFSVLKIALGVVSGGTAAIQDLSPRASPPPLQPPARGLIAGTTKLTGAGHDRHQCLQDHRP